MPILTHHSSTRIPYIMKFSATLSMAFRQVRVVLLNHISHLLWTYTGLIFLLKILIWLTNSDSINAFQTNDSLNYLSASKAFYSSYLSANRESVGLLIAPGFPSLLIVLQLLLPDHFIPLVLSTIPILSALILFQAFKNLSKSLATFSYIYVISEPVLFFESFYILSDSFFLLLISMTIWLIIRYQENACLLSKFILGAFVGFTTLTRPMLLYFPLALLFLLFIFSRRTFKYWYPSFLVYGLVVVVWVGHNYQSFEVPVISSVQYNNLILGEVVGMKIAEGEGNYEEVILAEDERRREALGDDPSPRDLYSYNSSRFNQVLFEGPWWLFVSHIRGVVAILFGFGEESISQVLGNLPSQFVLVVLVYSVLFSSSISVFLLYRVIQMLPRMTKIPPGILLACFYLSYVLLVSGGATAYSRFRIAVIPAIAFIILYPKARRVSSG
jgi:hypothetical protein